jgi:hypothetical protein
MVAANPPIGVLAPALPRPLFGLEYKWWLVLIAILPGFTVFLLDVTIVNVALARLGSVFEVNYATVQWVITGYSLASGIATPMASFLEKRFTMRRVWTTALAVFTSSSVLCGLAPAFWVLVVGRIVQGFAGGMMLPMAIATIFEVFPTESAWPGDGVLRHPDGGRPGAWPDHRRLHRDQLGLAARVLRQSADWHRRGHPELAGPATRQARAGYAVRHARRHPLIGRLRA